MKNIDKAEIRGYIGGCGTGILSCYVVVNHIPNSSIIFVGLMLYMICVYLTCKKEIFNENEK